MSRILILFAHPLLEKSRVHKALMDAAQKIPDVSFHDLYQHYPDYDIDVSREKELLLAHDILIWQHPFYWYSAPPLLKQWQDLVLEHGWAYGRHGTALEGKRVFNTISSGGSQEAYQYGGFNKYPIHDYLRPFERTAELCRMTYWPPFWLGGVHKMEEKEIRQVAQQYRNLLIALSKDLFAAEDIASQLYMNNLVSISSSK